MTTRLGLGAIAAGAVLLRLPLVLSRTVLTYDDGVYLASAMAMRAGGLPFRDVYSSQGPAFLPILRLADLLGLQASWAPRLAPLAAAVALVLVAFGLARRLGSDRDGLVAAALMATSGAVLFSTQRIEADGVAAALGAAAVLAAANRRSLVVTAVLLGLAVAVKSVFVGPAALAVLVLLGWRRGAIVAAGSTAVLVALSLPFGIGDVWHQFVGLHLDARHEPVDVLDRLDVLRQLLWRRDRLIIALGWIGLAVAVVRRQRLDTERRLIAALVVWLAASIVVLTVHTPLFAQHLAVVVPPAAVLAARFRPPWPVAVAVVAVLAAGHIDAGDWGVRAPALTPSQREAVELLRDVDGLVITDEPHLAWLAGRTIPGPLVDTSFVRIAAGGLSTEDVVAVANEPDVCAVLLWTGRLASLPGLLADLAPTYDTAFTDGPHRLLVKPGC